MKSDVDLFEIHESHYFYELQRRDQLNSAIGTPAGVLTLLIGACVAIATQAEYAYDLATGFLLVCLAASITAAGSCVWFLVRAYHDYEYRYVSTLEALQKFRGDLLAYHQAAGTSDPATAADAQFVEEMLAKYARAQQHNALNNDSKSYRLYEATRRLVATMVALALASVPFTWGKISHQPSDIQRIQIVNPPSESSSP